MPASQAGRPPRERLLSPPSPTTLVQVSGGRPAIRADFYRTSTVVLATSAVGTVGTGGGACARWP